MSLIVFNGSRPPSTPPEEQLYSVVLNNHINTLVIHNRATNEVTLAPPLHYDYNPQDTSFKGIKCPHCGSVFEEARGSASPTNAQGSTSTTIALDGGAAKTEGVSHDNYFKLLEDTFRLPDALFTQGYFEKFFREVSMVGRGSRGSVYKVEHILNGVSLGTFALKKITIGEDPVWLSKILKEVHMLVKISCNTTNLVNYNHVWLEVDRINEFGPRVPCAFILQQYCSGGNLEELVLNLKSPHLSVKEIKRRKIRKLKGRLLTNEEILIMFRSIVAGVSELHRNHIIHRDLKPSNCLLSETYLDKFENSPDLDNIPDVLIGDFGESQLEGEKRSGTGATGTLEYTAPELLDVDFGNLHQFNKKTDVYSLGMILVFMCYGGIPFHSTDVEELKREIASREMELQERDDIHPGFLRLIGNLTQRDQESRIETEDILRELTMIDSALQTNGRRLSLEDPVDPLLSGRKDSLIDYGVLLLQVLVLYSWTTSKTSYYPEVKEYLVYLILFASGLTARGSRVSQLALLSLTTAAYIFI